jgi:hypothetical protein
VNFVDRQNFIEYAIDDQNIRRTVVAKGRRTEEKPIPHGFGRPLNDEYRLSVRLETNTVEVSASTSSARVVQPTVVHGRFGFDREQTYTGFKFQGR